MFNASQRLLAKQWLKRKTREGISERDNLAALKIDGIKNPEEAANSLIYCASDNRGNSLFLRLNHRKFERVEVILFLVLRNGRIYEFPSHPNVVFDKISSKEWSVGDLKLRVLEKSRRVRMTYNGFMRRGNEIEHVRFNFIFIAKTKPRLRKDYWDLGLASKTLSQSSGNLTDWQRLWDGLKIDGADQWGSMMGQVFTEDGKVEDLFLHGFRSHLYDTYDQSMGLKKSFCLTGFTAKGMNFHIIVNDYDSGPQKIRLGHVKDGNDNFCSVKKIELNKLDELDLVNPGNDQFLIRFATSERDFQVNVKLIKETCLNLSNQEFQYCRLALEFNGCLGSGIVEIIRPNPRNLLPSLKNELSIKPIAVTLDLSIVTFEDQLCKIEELVGGKGSSLAKLSSLNSNQFSVPRGFCITVNAFKKHIELNECLRDGINELFTACGSLDKEKIEASCQRLELLFKKTALLEELREIILGKLVKSKKYAVRSSAVGEDGTDSSAAGQNATFLGICDFDELQLSVAKCWGSLYSYRSVEYRRQQGLPVKSVMGVCIQEMIDSDSAGVMFTRNPTSGNPKELIITSNYGLGETVVSASVEPDTIIISRDVQDSLQIKQVNIGSKGQKLKMDPSQGICKAEIPKEETESQSISDSDALELAKIGLYLEKNLNGPKDVEWAIFGGKIHLLQCRPITSLNNFTEFELTHELGTGSANDSDFYNFANFGEVFPYAISPLTLSTMVKSLEALMEYFLTSKVNFDLYKRHLFVGYNRLQMNHISLLKMAARSRKMLKLHDICMIGRVITTDEILELSKDRHGPPKKAETMIMMRTMSRGFFSSKKVIEKSECHVRSCEKKFAGELSARELYNRLGENLMDMVTSNMYHNMITCKSIMLQLMVMNIVTERSEEITEGHFIDISHLLKSCRNVISARVPVVMRNIAKTIRDSNIADDFKSVNSSKLDWLGKNCPKAHDQMKEFLDTYGHRAVMEWDLMTETWGMNPDELLSTIQVLASADLEIDYCLPKESIDVDKIINELTSPKKSRTKWLLRKLLPNCHKALQRREYAKSLLIKVVHIFRTNYIRLENLMIKEGLLPDRRLIFFLTHEEIGSLLDGKGAEFVRKAIQRRRFYPKLRSYQFVEFNVGMLKPIDVDEKSLPDDSGPLVKGTVVCGSKVSGRACVITNISEAVEICPGDILITKSTDIGWTPYFSILSGVVTEIGGIISHGSVVAREFNLPCLIGASNATKLFKTGDKVILDGNTGVVKLA